MSSEIVGITDATATKRNDIVVKTRFENISFDIGVRNEDGWFGVAAQILLAPNPGKILDLEADCGSRNGYRYAEEGTPVPSYVVRRLLRGPHGWQWLSALMDGCDQSWWRELQAARDLLIKFKIEAR